MNVNGGHFAHKSEPMSVTFWFVLFVLLILAFVNLMTINLNMCKLLILREMCYLREGCYFCV